MALSLAKTATKLAVGFGAVYVTYDQGVWATSSTQGSKINERFQNNVLPATQEYIRKIPTMSEIGNKAVSTWNYGVQSAFSGVSQAPDYIEDYSKKAADQVKRKLSSN